MSASEVRRFINSLPDKRAALQLLNALDQLIPTNKDTALTAHAGGGQASALALRSDCAFHDVTTVATAADSVALPYPYAGDMHFVKNSAALSMQVFAVTPGTIDSTATGTGVAQLAGDGVLYMCVVDGNYIRLGGVSSTEVFGTITAEAITGSDSSLGITGQAAAQGGAVVVTGGASSTGGNAGGAATIAGGAGGATGAGGAVTVTSGAGGATSGVSGDLTIATGTTTAGSGSATGAVIVQSGAGAGSAAAVAGGASGAVTLRSQAGGANTGGATGQAGGAAGTVSITGGAGGATNSAGAHAGGAGADVTLTAGAGGNATAGTGNGGAGGTIALVPGAGGTSAGGTAGVDGVVRVASTFSKKIVVTAMTTSATVTVAALRGGLITANQGGGAGATYTLPTGTAMDAAMPSDFVAGDSFDFAICNISTNAAEDVTVAGDTGMVAKGNMTVASNAAVGDIAAGLFRVVKEAANTYSFYRIS